MTKIQYGAQLGALCIEVIIKIGSGFKSRNLGIKTVEAHMTICNNMTPNMGPYSVICSVVAMTG